MKNIYEISTGYLSILEQIEENGGEITPEIETQLAINESHLVEKSKAYVGLIKMLTSSDKEIDLEIKRLQAIKKSRGNIAKNLKERLSNALKSLGIDEIKEPLFTINFRKSESVLINDVQALPDVCKIIKVEPISKAEIKKMIKSGEEVPGAEIITNHNIQIK